MLLVAHRPAARCLAAVGRCAAARCYQLPLPPGSSSTPSSPPWTCCAAMNLGPPSQPAPQPSR